MRRSPEEEESHVRQAAQAQAFLRRNRRHGRCRRRRGAGRALEHECAGRSAGPAPDVLARYVANHSGEMQQTQGYRFVTDTLGGARHLVVAQQVAQQVQPNRFTSDTIAGVHGYNPNAYVVGGSTPVFAQAAQDLGYGRTPAPVSHRQPDRHRPQLEGHRHRRRLRRRAAAAPPGQHADPQRQARRRHHRLTASLDPWGRGRRRPPTAPPWVNAYAHRLPAWWAFACPQLH